jgi:hypothetical protein
MFIFILIFITATAMITGRIALRRWFNPFSISFVIFG